MYSQYYQDLILESKRSGAVTNWTAYVALFNGNPASGGTELTTTITGGATREAVAWDAVEDNGSDGRKTVNASDIEIAASSAGSGTADYFAVYDGATGGNLRFYGALDPSFTFAAGQKVEIPAGQLADILPDA